MKNLKLFHGRITPLNQVNGRVRTRLIASKRTSKISFIRFSTVEKRSDNEVEKNHSLSCREGIHAVQMIIIACTLLFLTACEAEPTPFPAQIATSTPDTLITDTTPIPATPSVSTIRYGIDPSLGNIPLLIGASYTQIASQTPITLADLDVTYDLALRLGDAEGWSRLPNPMTIGVILRPSYEFADLIWRAIDPPEWIDALGITGMLPLHDGTTPITVLRTDMANLGKPDGFTLNMGVQNMIGEAQIQTQLGALFIETRSIVLSTENRLPLWNDGAVDMMLVSWLTESEKSEWVNLVGDANLLPLFTAPMSYIASSNMTITLSENGLPQVIIP